MADIKHTIPRPEHPNPQMKRERWVSLNGEWEFEKDFSVSGKARELYKAESLPERITVPFCMESDISGVAYKDFCECVWYRKEIEITEDWLADPSPSRLTSPLPSRSARTSSSFLPRMI